jgi:hypothetical protein
MLGGVQYLPVITSSLVFGLLKALSQSRERRFGEVVRPALQLSNVMETVKDKTDANVLMKWLLARRIVIRGATVRCPNCQLDLWYPLHRIAGPLFRCDGCFEEVEPPLPIDGTQWKYRVNELVARSFDQGVLPHLFTIVHSWDQHGVGVSETLGFHPGIRVERDSGKREPPFRAEIDFVEIDAGRLIIGECKVDGNELREEDVSKLLELARLFNCSRVLFSTFVPWAPGTIALLKRSQRRTSALVELCECEQLTDRTFSQRSREDDVDPDTGPSKYLHHIVANYLNADLGLSA